MGLRRSDVHRLPVKLDVDRGMIFDARNTVECVQVLVKGDLEDGGTALATDDDTVGKEEDPDSIPPFTIGFDNVLLIADPVLVPLVNGRRIMNTEDINILDLKTGTLELCYGELITMTSTFSNGIPC